MNDLKTNIGQGIYTAADASRILKVPYPKANYWFNYYAKQRFPSTAHHIYQTIYNLVRAGESKKSIAKLYNLNINQINDALEFSKAA